MLQAFESTRCVLGQAYSKGSTDPDDSPWLIFLRALVVILACHGSSSELIRGRGSRVRERTKYEKPPAQMTAGRHLANRRPGRACSRKPPVPVPGGANAGQGDGRRRCNSTDSVRSGPPRLSRAAAAQRSARSRIDGEVLLLGPGALGKCTSSRETRVSISLVAGRGGCDRSIASRRQRRQATYGAGAAHDWTQERRAAQEKLLDGLAQCVRARRATEPARRPLRSIGGISRSETRRSRVRCKSR